MNYLVNKLHTSVKPEVFQIIPDKESCRQSLHTKWPFDHTLNSLCTTNETAQSESEKDCPDCLRLRWIINLNQACQVKIFQSKDFFVHKHKQHIFSHIVQTDLASSLPLTQQVRGIKTTYLRHRSLPKTLYVLYHSRVKYTSMVSRLYGTQLTFHKELKAHEALMTA